MSCLIFELTYWFRIRLISLTLCFYIVELKGLKTKRNSQPNLYPRPFQTRCVSLLFACIQVPKPIFSFLFLDNGRANNFVLSTSRCLSYIRIQYHDGSYSHYNYPLFLSELGYCCDCEI